MFKYFSDEQLSLKNGQSATISTVNWLALELLSLLNFIPLVGTIVWLILYILLCVKGTTAPSIRSYIKLSLILALIGTIVGIVIGVIVATWFSDIFITLLNY